jgi:Antitoxin-like ribbon-helix-helix
MGNNGGGAALCTIARRGVWRFSMRKMIHIATASRDALERLAADNGKSFQDLIDEAIADLLKKHKRPVTLTEMLRGSLADGEKRKTANRRPT